MTLAQNVQMPPVQPDLYGDMAHTLEGLHKEGILERWQFDFSRESVLYYSVWLTVERWQSGAVRLVLEQVMELEERFKVRIELDVHLDGSDA